MNFVHFQSCRSWAYTQILNFQCFALLWFVQFFISSTIEEVGHLVPASSKSISTGRGSRLKQSLQMTAISASDGFTLNMKIIKYFSAILINENVWAQSKHNIFNTFQFSIYLDAKVDLQVYFAKAYFLKTYLGSIGFHNPFLAVT